MSAMTVMMMLSGSWAAAQGAIGTAEADGDVGRIYTYVRSNSDGSEAETIHVYRATRERIEVSKMRERCTNAAFVTAEMDLERGQALTMTGGRLTPGGGHEDFAWLDHDRSTGRLTARVRLPQGEMKIDTAIEDEPWHLYDFDLASLTIANRHRADRRADMSFGLPLIMPGAAGPPLTYLGRAELRFVAEEPHEGRPALRFEAGGPALGERGGPIWFDAAEGHVLAARWGVPNHPGYSDFTLRLAGTRDGGEAMWRELLTAHFEGCGERN